MITPSRWFTGGQGLNDFRKMWINNKHLSKLIHFNNASEVFPGRSIAGGVNYFLWDANKVSNNIDFYNSTDKVSSIRVLNKFDIFMINTLDESIVSKVVDVNKAPMLSSIVGSGGVYGLPTNWRSLLGDIKVITSDGIFYCEPSDIKVLPVGYRVVVSNVMSEHAGESSKDGTYKVVTKIQLADPNTVMAGHYIPIGPFKDSSECINCVKYISTKFLRLLIKLRAVGIGITSDSYKFVPIQDFTDNSDIDWSLSVSEIDKQLYKKYNLTQEEIDYIERTIKPME